MPDSLSLPELGTILVWVVGATVFAIQKIKAFVCQHFKGGWTQKVPWWAWLAASVAIPFGLVVLVCQSWAQALINPMLPEALRLNLNADAIIPTALTATIGANGSYAVAKRLGLTKDYTAGGPNDVTPKPESSVVATPVETASVESVEESPRAIPQVEISPVSVTPEAASLPSRVARLARFTNEFPDVVIVMDTQEVIPVDREKPRWVAGPTESSPNHLLIPGDWLAYYDKRAL